MARWFVNASSASAVMLELSDGASHIVPPLQFLRVEDVDGEPVTIVRSVIRGGSASSASAITAGLEAA